jgi:hypothetical protein
LKTSNNKILEKPGVTGKGNIIQSFCIISWGWKYNLKATDSVLLYANVQVYYLFSSKRGHSATTYIIVQIRFSQNSKKVKCR